METFKNKYTNQYNDIFKGEGKHIQKDNIVKKEVTDYPQPTKYRISTMTMITSFNCNINFFSTHNYCPIYTCSAFLVRKFAMMNI